MKALVCFLCSAACIFSLSAREAGGMRAAPRQLEGGQRTYRNPAQERAFERGAEEGMYLNTEEGFIDGGAVAPYPSYYPYPSSQPGLNDLNNSTPDVNNPHPNAKDLNNSIPDVNNPFDND